MDYKFVILDFFKFNNAHQSETLHSNVTLFRLLYYSKSLANVLQVARFVYLFCVLTFIVMSNCRCYVLGTCSLDCIRCKLCRGLWLIPKRKFLVFVSYEFTWWLSVSKFWNFSPVYPHRIGKMVGIFFGIPEFRIVGLVVSLLLIKPIFYLCW